MVLFVLGMGFMVLSAISSYFVKSRIEQSLGIKIQGKFSPSLFRSSFSLQQGAFQWKDKVALDSGDLSVDYSLRELPGLMAGESLRIQVSGQNLNIHLYGDWADLYGSKAMPVRQFELDCSFDRSGINEIHGLDVNSPYMNIKIQESERSRLQ